MRDIWWHWERDRKKQRGIKERRTLTFIVASVI
jgi:hypothetical protein